MAGDETFRARFRFRLQTKLNIKDRKHRFVVNSRDVLLSAQADDVNICDSEWLVMNTVGFQSESEAVTFGQRLRAAAECSSAATRLGIDAGLDRATSGMSNFVRKSIFEATGEIVRDNVHGLDVFVDTPATKIFSISGTGTVHKDPTQFLSELDRLHSHAHNLSKTAQNVLLLLNVALMRPEPVAKILFSVSAVEMLGQQERWSESQKALLDELADRARDADMGTVEEREEVADAIRRGTQKISLRQGVIRLLTDLELSHLKKEWDDLYGQRSILVGCGSTPAERIVARSIT